MNEIKEIMHPRPDATPTPPADEQTHFVELLRGAEKDLKAYVGALVRDFSAREDVFQEICLTLWKAFPKYDVSQSFGAWARGVATNKILQVRKKDARMATVFSTAGILAVQEAWHAAEDAQNGQQEQRFLDACVEELPLRSRTLLSLHYTQNVPAVRIAEQLGQTANAIHQSLSRIRNRLMECVRRKLLLLRSKADTQT